MKYANMVLDLDPAFSPTFGLFDPKIPRIAFKSFVFYGGEPHIRILTDLSEVKEVHLSHRIQSFNDMGLLLLAIDALKRGGVERIHLFLPYFPGARQDRLMTQGEALTVKVYADILNASGISSIRIFDPHSEVAPALLADFHALDNHDFIARVVSELGEGIRLISPDAGALKKIYKLAAHLKNPNIVECGKTRDVMTGDLSGFTVNTTDLEGADCLIVDDICDGGGTFLGLANELKKKNAGKLYLAVSHGIFSNGLEELTSVFDRVLCTDSFKTIENTEGVTQVALSDILSETKYVTP